MSALAARPALVALGNPDSRPTSLVEGVQAFGF
jgi:hypothetical protein